MTHVAILDDYQDVALRMVDWRALPADVEVEETYRVFYGHAGENIVAFLSGSLSG